MKINTITLFIYLVGLFSIVSCGKGENPCTSMPLAEADLSSSEEYAIIDALLESYYNEVGFWHISQETHYFEDTSLFQIHFKTSELMLSESSVEGYKALNSTPHYWGQKFTNEYDFISNEGFECLYDNTNPGWSQYYEDFEASSGVFRPGRPYINETNNAVVVYEINCGWLCDSGYTATLHKQDGKWIVDKNIIIWIS